MNFRTSLCCFLDTFLLLVPPPFCWKTSCSIALNIFISRRIHGGKIFETSYVFILYSHLIDCMTGNRIQYKLVFTLSSEFISPLPFSFQCCFEKSSDCWILVFIWPASSFWKLYFLSVCSSLKFLWQALVCVFVPFERPVSFSFRN